MEFINHHIPEQIPEHLRADAPLFVDFLTTYYEYAEQRDKAVGLVINGHLDFDIDACEADYVSKFYQSHSTLIPKNLAIDRRNFIKLLSSIYTAKGTDKAIKLLFLAVFGEIITITKPGEQILKASDGEWVAETFITVQSIFGTPPVGEADLIFTNSYGNFTFTTTHIDSVDVNIDRFYFYSYNKIVFENDQKIFYYNFDGDLVYAGLVINSPARIKVVQGGKNWQQGQVIIIPGTIKNTVARVSGIGVDGTITKVEILEYGYSHDLNQTLTVSPYPIKPSVSNVDITSVLVSTSPLAYHHYVTIIDYTEGIAENIIGVASGLDPNSYFLEDYTTDLYSGYVVFGQSNTYTAPAQIFQASDISIETWLESRATLSYEHDALVKTKGTYRDAKGQLSHQEIRLQDNYFYQAFSYLIETSRDIKEYQDVLSLVHPAGTKRFSNLSKFVDYDFNFSSSRVLSFDTIYAIDFVSKIDERYLSFTKSLAHSVVISEGAIDRSFTKVFDGLDFASVNDTYDKTITKNLTDTSITSESMIRDLSKSWTDNILTDDVLTKDLSRVMGTDTVLTSEVVSLLKSFYRDMSVDTVITSDVLSPSLDKSITTDTVSTSEIVDVLISFYRNNIDTILLSETLVKTLEKTPPTDPVSVTDLLVNNLNKYSTDDVVVNAPATNSVITTSYMSEDYFSEEYAQYEHFLTIG